MDSLSADLAIQAILGRGADFVSGIDNEGLDFSQLEDFINNDGSPGNTSYFGESLNSTPPTSAGKLLNVIVENKRNQNNGHSLPESPPDSSSEHPYSPQDGCEAHYTNIYKPTTILNPILTDNLILGSHIVVTDQNNEQLLDSNGGLLQDGRLLQNSQLLLTADGASQNFDRALYNDKSNTTAPAGGHLVHLSYSNIENIPRAANLESGAALCEATAQSGSLDGMPSVYTNLQSASKKRKLSQDSPLLVKSEPDHGGNIVRDLSPTEQLATSIDEDYASSEACLSESQYQCIRFNAFQQGNWHTICDQNLTELPTPHYRVDADKGFNFSNADDAFVCQKKNHFQITCHVQLLGDAQFVKTPDGLQKIASFHLHFYGVKHDCPTQTIRVEQSQSDRSKKPFHPVLVELVSSQVTKVTVGRLHFSETTSNNMRKKGKPNPEQRYFQLVVGLHAHTTNGNFPVISHASQKIIVRASNPGQFESDVELCWQKGQTADSVVHNGRVGINTDRPDESLVVHGNIKITGHIIQPSDIRAKKNIVECNTAEQLRNVQRLRVVRYEYEPSLAKQLRRDDSSVDTGVIAQEVAEILPEAVRPAGDLILNDGRSIDNFLVVNKERIFMENIGAVKELCKVTDNLETRIDQLERINRRLNKLKRGDSLKSNSTVSSSKIGYPAHKCNKHHNCRRKHEEEEEELCSNKFIQIVIVVLVLIMAFCLAAITTLYLMEAARHSQYLQTNLELAQRSLVTKRPTKLSKLHSTWHTVAPQRSTTNSYTEDGDVTRITLDASLIKRSIIGRPSECLAVEQDLENSNLCQIYCCAIAPIVAPPEPYGATIAKPPNRTEILNEKRISKHLPSNDIDKTQARHKRDTYDLADDPNSFDTIDEQMSIIVQGSHFNTTLSQKYLNISPNSGNYSYIVPISKYMPDDFVNLVFRWNQVRENQKEIEHCYNDNSRQFECNFVGGGGGNGQIYYEEKRLRHKVNENTPSPQMQSVVFEVDMADFQSKVMTYRTPLRPVQNLCKMSPSKVGLEFTEYNFHFYRHCDE